MTNRGYRSYHGRRSIWKYILLLLLLVLACGLMLAQQYITYSDDGSIRFEVPFFTREEPDDIPVEDEVPQQQIDLVIESDSVEQENPPEEEDIKPAISTYHLKGISELPADSTQLQAELQKIGANGFVCALRDNTGRVFYDSAVAMKDAVSTSFDSAVLREFCALEGIVSVARLNAFHDSYYAWANMESAGICQSNGYIWYDNRSWHWLEPEKEAARAYVISLAVECAQMGFDQIVLEEVCYPTKGNVYKIDYSGNTMERWEALALFLTEMRTALEPYGTGLALLVDEKTLDSTANKEYIEGSGQDLFKLLPLVDAVYVATADPVGAQAMLSTLAEEREAPALVPVTDTMPEGNWYIP